MLLQPLYGSLVQPLPSAPPPSPPPHAPSNFHVPPRPCASRAAGRAAFAVGAPQDDAAEDPLAAAQRGAVPALGLYYTNKLLPPLKELMAPCLSPAQMQVGRWAGREGRVFVRLCARVRVRADAYMCVGWGVGGGDGAGGGKDVAGGKPQTLNLFKP